MSRGATCGVTRDCGTQRLLSVEGLRSDNGVPMSSVYSGNGVPVSTRSFGYVISIKPSCRLEINRALSAQSHPLLRARCHA